MSELLSMVVPEVVVPLQTLPGWPAAPNPPWLDILALLFGVPIAFGLIVTLIAKTGAAIRARRYGTAGGLDEPLWLGGPYGTGAAAVAAGNTRALSDRGASTPATLVAPHEATREIGGISARW